MKMKKLCNIVTALMAIVAMVACSTNDTYTQTQPEQQAEPLAITFSPYVGRSVTRANIQDENSLQKNGIALYAMLTDGKYDPTATNNSNTFSSLKDNNLFYDSNASKWIFGSRSNGNISESTLYWPVNPNIYYSFLASAFNGYTLVGPTGGTDGNKTYVEYTFDNDLAGGADVMRSKNDLSNMQCRWTTHAADPQTGQQESSTITTVADDADAFTANHDVYLRMIHPTARIALSLTSTAMLNPEFYDTTKDGKATSTTLIKVNKFMLLGDNKTATTDSPIGAFTKKAYLNLAGKVKGKAGDPDDSYTITDENKWGKLWMPDATADKMTFIPYGLYKGTFADDYSADTEHTTADTGRKMWIPDPNTTKMDTISGSATVSGGTVSNATVNSIGSNPYEYLFIVPQDFSKDDGDKLYCYVNYTVSYRMKHGFALKADTYEGYVQIKKNFVAGGAYVIRIDINTNVAAPVPITYSVVEEPRADEEKVPATL